MTSLRVPPSALSVWRRISPVGLAAAAIWLAAGPLAPAAEPLSAPPTSAAGNDDVWILTPPSSGAINGGNPVAAHPQPADVGGFGFNARLGHMAGPAVGRRESATFLELTPFTTLDTWFIGGDFRLLRPNEGNLGGSGGVILRRYNPRRNAIFGANVFYDVDDTRGRQFEQVGVGLEWLSAWLDIRANGYLPTGNDKKVLAAGVVRGSERFVGYNLFYDRFSQQATASTGVDMLFTVPIPGRWAEAVNLEASAGWYYFSPNDERLSDFAGGRLRVDGSIIKRLLHAYVEYSNDRAFDSLVSVGVDVNYWNRYDNQPRIGGNQFHRITDYVRRNWTVVAVNETAFDRNLIAVNPATGTPYIIEHVDTNGNSLFADGTFERPYTTLIAAQNNAPSPPNNIIYVHAGSVFNTPLVMNNGEVILGEGVAHELALPGVPDVVILPRTGKAGGKPVFDQISGVPVRLANNTTFGGFAISRTSIGPAILGNGITNARLVDIDIQDVNGGHGVHFLNAHGRITLDNVNMLRSNPADPNTGVDLDDFRVEGGNAEIIYRNSRIENTQGRAVRIVDAGGRVDMRTVTINSRFTVVPSNDEGVIVQNSSADVLFGPMDLQSGSLDLLNISGDITFAGPIQLISSNPNPENPNAFPVHVNGSSGLILFQPGATVNVLTRQNTGIDLRNISGTIRFSDNITVAGGNFLSPALVWQQNSGSFISDGTFTAGVVGTNGPAQSQGILIGSRSGALSNQAGSTFTMNGQFTIVNTYGQQLISPGPPVVNQANSAIEILNDPTNVTFNGGLITGRNPDPPAPLARAPTGGIEIFNTTGTIRFNGTTLIENEPLDTADPLFDPPSPESAVEMVQAAGPIFWDILTVRAAAEGTTNQPGVFGFQSGDIHFNQLNVEFNSTDNSQNGAVNITQSGNITANGGVISAGFLTAAGGGTAIILEDNARIAWVSDSVSSRNDQFGIIVRGQPGSFVVRGGGPGVVPGSGGSILNTTSTVGIDVGAIFDYSGQDLTDPNNFVSLNGMVFSVQDRAIQATNLNRLEISNSVINGTIFSGAVLLNDVLNFRVQDSAFTNNFGNVVLATITTNPPDSVFDYRFERNRFVDGAAAFSASMIRIDNIGGGAGATLDLVVRDNGGPLSGFTGFVSNRFNPNIANPNLVDESSAFAVRWNGPVRQALFERNSFALIGGIGQEGVEFVNASTAHMTNFIFRQNTLTTNEASDAIGVRLDVAGRANVQIVGNQTLNTPGTPFRGFIMNGLRAQAYSLTLRGANNRVRLDDNEIQFFNDDAIGFHFPYIGGNTEFFINGNRIRFNQQFTSVGPGERGFAFGPMAGTMFFHGDRNNLVEYLQPDAFSRPFPDPFLAPHIGTFLLNGVRVPQ